MLHDFYDSSQIFIKLLEIPLMDEYVLQSLSAPYVTGSAAT